MGRMTIWGKVGFVGLCMVITVATWLSLEMWKRHQQQHRDAEIAVEQLKQIVPIFNQLVAIEQARQKGR